MYKKYRIMFFIFLYIVVFIWIVLYFIFNLVNQIAITSFKKLYSSYSQALILTADQMNGEIGCYFSTDGANNFSKCDKFYKIFASNLRVTKYCKNNSLSNGCIPQYKKYATKPSCAGFSENMMNRYNQTFVMNDNSSITVFNQPQDVSKPLFAVDSNGKLFPNQTGYDLFSFIIMRNSRGIYYFHSNVTYCLPLEKGGIEKLQDIYD